MEIGESSRNTIGNLITKRLNLFRQVIVVFISFLDEINESSKMEMSNHNAKSYSFDETLTLNRNQLNQMTSVSNLKEVPMIEIKEIACYLSLLEGGDVKDKLECKLLSAFLAKRHSGHSQTSKMERFSKTAYGF